MPRVRVIGCGNPDAGDDAVGLIVVRGLREELKGLDGVEVVEAGPAFRVLDLVEDVEAIVVVDAVRAPSGRRSPGELVRAEGGPEGLPAELSSSLSSHGLGLADAVGLVSALGRAPHVVFHGVEAADSAAGSPLSEAVANALASLAERIASDVRALLGSSL